MFFLLIIVRVQDHFRIGDLGPEDLDIEQAHGTFAFRQAHQKLSKLCPTRRLELVYGGSHSIFLRRRCD